MVPRFKFSLSEGDGTFTDGKSHVLEAVAPRGNSKAIGLYLTLCYFATGSDTETLWSYQVPFSPKIATSNS